MIKEIDVQTLKIKIDQNDDFILLDIRTDSEYYLSNINASVHIPMNEIPEKFKTLDKDKEIIVQCKSGKRSAKVCEFLLKNNFNNVKNLKGGILDWAKHIDPSIIVY
tara:strand:- start:2920 stop:3240 length:321 start_codon:yes stop_codon:yes gene_type:complete